MFDLVDRIDAMIQLATSAAVQIFCASDRQSRRSLDEGALVIRPMLQDDCNLIEAATP
jgi:hypothetical protein